MKVAVLKEPEVIQLENSKKPEADNDYLVVEVKACGICGSDVRYYKGENPWALHTLGKNLPNPPNIILGHEWGGIVHEVKNPEFKHLLGKRVAVLAYNTCGVCEYCRNGNYNLCKKTMHIGHGAGWGTMDYYPGGMAEYCQIWNTHVCEIPDSMSFEEATLLDPVSVGIHAITKSDIRPGEDVVVLGTGAVGLSIVQAVKAFGADRVICTDVYEGALEIARDVGVTRAVNVRQESLEDAMGEIGMNGANVVFDTVGTADTQKQALHILRESGTLVNLVANMTQASYELMDLAGEKRLITSANNNSSDFLLGIKLIENGTIQAKKMITHVLPLDEVQTGFDIMLNKEQEKVMKVVLVP